MRTINFRLVGILVIVVNLFSSCEKGEDNTSVVANKLSLSDTYVELSEIGEKYQLYATVMPEDADIKTVKWTSSETDVMSVSSSGMITVKSSGSAIITATLVANTTISASCEITVKKHEVVGKWISKGAAEMVIQFNGLANPEEGRFTYDEFIAYCEESLVTATTAQDSADFISNISYAQQCVLIYGEGCSLNVMEQRRLKVTLGKEGLYCSDCSWEPFAEGQYTINFTEKWNTPRVRNSILTLNEDINTAVLNISPEPAASHTWFISFEREK